MYNKQIPCICMEINAASLTLDSFSNLHQLSHIISNLIITVSAVKHSMSQPDTWIYVSLSLHALYTLFSLLFQETLLYL